MRKTVLEPITIFRTKVKNEVKVELQEEKQVIIHFVVSNCYGRQMRIWKTTYLVTEDQQKIPMVFWKGISLYPKWTDIDTRGNFYFTLIFTGLPSDCKVFSLIEEIPEPGGFDLKNIPRDKKDVYHIGL